VLAEWPDEWSRRVTRWAALNRPHKVDVDDAPAPDANEEYLLYQTLVGAWPEPGSPDDDLPAFTRLVQENMNKATHEAKVNTSWINPNAEYDAAVAEFVARVLDPAKSGEFLEDLKEFVGRVAPVGLFNSLAQTILRCTAPGVPDTYQGTELWDFSLVDPDNRRPVDYRLRHRLLADLDAAASLDAKKLAREILARKEDGRVKLFVTSRALRLRRELSDVFGTGSYDPVEPVGARADHLFGFVRSAGEAAVLVAVPRLIGTLVGESGEPPIGSETWAKTAIRLPEALANRTWVSAFTGDRVRAEGGTVPAAALFADLPAALLVAE
jgi:(1->4)-alpha-D-glucan 1-alpha-D-glucosylmutase